MGLVASSATPEDDSVFLGTLLTPVLHATAERQPVWATLMQAASVRASFKQGMTTETKGAEGGRLGEAC